jgi:predicted Fe-Mo cluster-binding NifX family protein
MKRYEYKFHTNNGIKTITVKGKGIKQAIKEFDSDFLQVDYKNKNNTTIYLINNLINKGGNNGNMQR